MDFSTILHETTKEKILNRQLDMKAMNDGINLGNEISKDLPNIRQAYAAQAMDEIRKSLYVKVQTLIRDEKVKELQAQMQEVEEGKITLVERIFGKGKLKEEQLRAIELQIRSLTDQAIETKEQYSVRDSLAEMKAFAASKEATKEMDELETNIYQIFGGFTREEVDEIAKTKRKAQLPITVQGKIGLFRIRSEANKLKQKNNIVEEEIQENVANSTRKDKIQGIEAKQDAITMFKNKLKTIGNVIKNREEIQIAKQEFEMNGQNTARLW